MIVLAIRLYCGSSKPLCLNWVLIQSYQTHSHSLHLNRCHSLHKSDWSACLEDDYFNKRFLSLNLQMWAALYSPSEPNATQSMDLNANLLLALHKIL